MVLKHQDRYNIANSTHVMASVTLSGVNIVHIMRKKNQTVLVTKALRSDKVLMRGNVRARPPKSIN